MTIVMVGSQLWTEDPRPQLDVYAGIVKDCRLVSGCMHRFCSECIEKWLRVARCASSNIATDPCTGCHPEY